MALVTFNTEATIVFDFDDATTPADIEARVKAIPHPLNNAGTAIGLAMSYSTKVLHSQRGYRGGALTTIVLTDGNTQETPAQFDARRSKLVARGSVIHAVGVGAEVTSSNDSAMRDLNDIPTTGTGREYRIVSFDELVGQADRIANDTICGPI